jgi:hypothetical protein
MFKFSKFQDGGRWLAAILDFQIPITFEPLDRSFRNLVANFGATSDIARTVHFLNSRWWLPDGSHLEFFLNIGNF